MKSSKPLKTYLPDLAFIALIIMGFSIYFIVYMTPSRIAWYREMRKQVTIVYRGVTGI